MTDRPTADERLFKVVFDLPMESPTWPPVSSESLWAAKTPVKFHLALRNIPFYAKGVAYGDVVLVQAYPQRREIVFERFVSESGHSAIQVLLRSQEHRDRLEGILNDFAVTWETASGGNYYAVDVKPATDYAAFRSALVDMDGAEVLMQESAISNHHRSQGALSW
jgi:hypothetical protein